MPPNEPFADFGLCPVTAAEIEFYLHGAAPSPDFWREVERACGGAGVGFLKCEKEKGPGQYEIALIPSRDPAKTASDIAALKIMLPKSAKAHGMRADFAARPLADEPGSGLHIHVHLEDGQGKNVFYKDDERMSDALAHSLGGLLAWLPDCMAVFAPNPESYARFTEKSNAPLNASWGANNRTVAVRLPDAPHDRKRIEHRVAGADADPQKVMEVILAAMHWGLQNKARPGPQIHGDASLPMYDLPRFPQTLQEAGERMEKSPFLSS